MRKNNKKELKKDFKNHMVESLEHEKEYIRIQAKSCRILVRGKNLNISYYTNEEMKITGIIQSIEYE